jgi:hypothetical protein
MSLLKQKEMNDRIDSVINDNLDASSQDMFAKLQLSGPAGEGQAVAKRDEELDQIIEGFEVCERPTSQEKRKKRRQSSKYELDSLQKLRQEGYNIFQEEMDAPPQYFRGSLPISPARATGLSLIDESTLRRGRGAHFFKEFSTAHQKTVQN